MRTSFKTLASKNAAIAVALNHIFSSRQASSDPHFFVVLSFTQIRIIKTKSV